MIVLMLLVLLWAVLLEIVPLFFQKSTTQPVAGFEALHALQPGRS
jgi:cytochrome c oxidase cbb3-type subunit 2